MRRADTEMQEKIEALIQEESDPRERARLLILYQIATVLIDNVAAVRETTDEFRKHRVEYEKHILREESFINQGRGMWRVAALLMAVVQSTLGYLFYENANAVKELQTSVVIMSRDFAIIKERHRIEDAKKGLSQ